MFRVWGSRQFAGLGFVALGRRIGNVGLRTWDLGRVRVGIRIQAPGT